MMRLLLILLLFFVLFVFFFVFLSPRAFGQIAANVTASGPAPVQHLRMDLQR